MNPDPSISTEGNDPAGAADRLGNMIDQVLEACPDAVVLVAMIINTCDPNQEPATQQYQSLIPNVVHQRRSAGKHVLAADFTTFPTDLLRDDCIHPTDQGYVEFGDYWYDFVHQIPTDWINAPVGNDPDRSGGANANGGIDQDIPPPDWGTSPVQVSSPQDVLNAAVAAINGDIRICNTVPHWYGTGKIALGLGHDGAWQYAKNWVQAGELAAGIGRDPNYVRCVSSQENRLLFTFVYHTHTLNSLTNSFVYVDFRI